jgi:signal transduction histidine kinase
MALPAADLLQLDNLQPVSRFVARARMQDQDLLAETNAPTAALLFVEVPLRGDDQPHLVGVIQFVMDGSGIAEQYADLDRNLALKFSLAFVVGAGILVTGLGLALRRVQNVNRKLAERTRNLLQANRELALAARTSAVGAVASHLIHGLRNPLSGLRLFVDAHNAGNGANPDTDWRSALSSTQRMEELINRVVRVLQEQHSGAEYEISIPELAALLTERAKTAAETAGVRFETKILSDQQMISNRDADLILLILENLAQNAIEATPPGNAVEVSIDGDTSSIVFEVHDQGPGLPAGMENRLFMPCTSKKKGGGGIGLAISKQLAQSLGARLELAGNTASGCVFRLIFPRQGERLQSPEPARAIATEH